MKSHLFYIALIVAGSSCTLHAQTPESRRFEVETGAYTLRLPSPDNNGWTIRQQVTGYLGPRLGIAFGLAWGASANADPLKSGQNPSYFADPNRLTEFYRRNQQMVDLSLVALPILSRRHQLKVQAGLSIFRRREIGIDSLVEYAPGNIYAVLRYTDTRRVVPMAGAGYDFRLSPRWAVGVNGTAYFSDEGKPTTTLGVRATYRFGLSADSLGMKPIPWDDLRVGVRLGANVIGRNGRGPGDRYRTKLVGGLWAEMPLSLTWAVRGEINYAQRGYRIDEVKQGNTRYLAASANLNYLETPLLFRHEVAYRWYLYGGPYLAFFLNGSSETEGKPNPAVQPHTTSGLMLGASYNLTSKLVADIRYQRDLIQISTTPYGGFHSFQATLGWAFR
ncbi:porin family protein [Spirosoma soli]|uniref:Porin family protein n=1 Tax=Spirosoma soli TaxID=1770529 RepID=A0ABW5M7U0_9BACT